MNKQELRRLAEECEFALRPQIGIESFETERQRDNARYLYITATPPHIILALLNKIEQQQAEIERLKCCGNCTYYETVCGEGKCFVDCDDLPASRYDKKVKYAEGSSKCDKWDGQK
jgi:hypothetical protein